MIFLEEDFVDGFFDAVEVEVRLREDEIRIAKVQVEAFLAEDTIPYLRLDVPIDEVTFLKGELIEETAHVLRDGEAEERKMEEERVEENNAKE